MNDSSFTTLNLQAALLDNLNSLNYQTMTAIQAQSLPLILAGKDIIAQAKTGSGKTAAFGLGILNKLDVKKFRVQTLVLCPTRELADQVAKELRRLARGIHNIKILTLCGGLPFGPQIGSLEHGAHIIVGTPGRVEEHLRKATLKLDHLHTFVLDEADRMLDMGFHVALDAILSYIPTKRQTLLFSATYPDKIQSIAKQVMHDPVLIQVESTHDNESIQQQFYKVCGELSRTDALRLILLQQKPESAIIFCNTKRETKELTCELRDHGFSALALHGDLEQKDREQTLARFINKSASILVATDVAARGLDIDALDAVINYHIARDLEVHTHRIGRTGRAGNKGFACTLYTDKERYKFEKLQDYLAQTLSTATLPSAQLLDEEGYKASMTTLQIAGGKKQKVRAGDILGALTGEDGIAGNQVGKIQIGDNWSYVAIKREANKAALRKLSEGKIKGRHLKVRQLRG